MTTKPTPLAAPSQNALTIAEFEQMFITLASDPRAYVPILWRGPPGVGKCLGRGTPVLRFDGTVVAVENVKVGDLLMGPDSQPRRVQSTTTGSAPLFQIIPNKGQPWVCNDVHVLTLVHSETDEVFDISLDKYLTQAKSRKHHQKQFHVAVEYHEDVQRPLPVSPYFLGVWLGDGTKNLDQGVHITKADPEILSACFAEAQHFGLVVVSNDSAGTRCVTHRLSQKGGQAAGGRGSRNPITDTMRELFGEEPTFAIPHQYMVAKREDRLALLAGLLDTDGHLISNCYEIVQKRKPLAESIVRLVRSLGLQATLSEKTVPEYGTYFRVFISGDVAHIPCRIARKQASPRRQKKDVTRTGFEVMPLGEGDYYGFTLDGDGRFLLGDFTVTHNTQTMGRLAEALDLALSPLEFAHCAEEDAGGIPVRDEKTGQVVRLPIGPIAKASAQACILFLDEVSRANEVKQGALLTLINERRAGDFRLHPDTVVALAANGTESTGAFKLIDAMQNRICIVDALPSLEEVCEYLRQLGASPSESNDPYEIALRDMGIDWAATAERTPQLIQIVPAPGTVDNGEQWPSPRMCEKGVRALAKLHLQGGAQRVVHKVLSGCVSEPVANAYFAVRALRDQLPTAAEIAADPKKAKIPSNIETAHAVMALVEQAGTRNPDSAWVYAQRIKFDDISVALGKRLTARVPATSAEAKAARVQLLKSQISAVRVGM